VVDKTERGGGKMSNTRTLETIKAEIREWLTMEMLPALTIDVIIKYIELAHIRGQMDAGKQSMDIVDKQLSDSDPNDPDSWDEDEYQDNMSDLVNRAHEQSEGMER